LTKIIILLALETFGNPEIVENIRLPGEMVRT